VSQDGYFFEGLNILISIYCSVAYPVPVDPWIRDLGWVNNQNPGSRSGMKNADHISESLETILWVKIGKFFYADPGSRMEKIRIRDKHPGSAVLIFCVCTGGLSFSKSFSLPYTFIKIIFASLK
jgi:hypothetical protein